MLYFPQIDGLRALAVTGVVYWHSVPHTQYLNSVFHLGGHGVRLFFVISGFLITLILLKEKREKLGFSFGGVLKSFYIRRALRIWPAYYLYLIIISFLAWDKLAESFPWHFFFLSNIYHSLQNEWTFMTAHYWTLAVEEQFYLVWPIIILLVRPIAAYIIVIILIFCAPIFRYWANMEYPDELIIVLPLPAQLDSLGVGALLALLYSDGFINRCVHSRKILSCIFILSMSIYVLFGFSTGYTGIYFIAISSSISAFAFAAVVGKSVLGVNGWFGIFLNNSIVRYIGKVSFGIYIYHVLVILLVNKILNDPHIVFLVSLLLSTALAGISWRLLENPFNKLKIFYPYTGAKPIPFQVKIDYYLKNIFR